MAITYHRALTELKFDVPETPLQVKLDGRIVGLIRATNGGVAYYPKGAGSKGRGEVYPTVEACKRSLESNPERFCSTIRVMLQELYKCNGVDGFNDLIVDKLGHDIADAAWTVTGFDADNVVIIEVSGEVFTGD